MNAIEAIMTRRSTRKLSQEPPALKQASTGSIWTITHTGVDPAYGDKGIAKILVERIIKEARAGQIKIIPLCS